MNDGTDSRGALTGATGDLTPEDTDRSFVPGERREIERREGPDDAARSRPARPRADDAAADHPERR